jgi:hypothetical protein
MDDESDNISRLEDRIEQLEATTAKMLPSRREAIGMGVAGLAGASLMSGTASAGSAQIGTIGNSNNRVDLFGEDVDISDTLTVGGQTTFNGPVVGVEGVPAGGIIMWSGTIANIPSGFALCDGTNGTPDLRDRFVVGAGGSEVVGDTGGTNTQSVNVSVSDSAEVGFDLAANQGQQFSDNRLAVRSSGQLMLPDPNGNDLAVFNPDSNSNFLNGGTASVNVNASGSDSFDNRPAYYALAYIMKL